MGKRHDKEWMFALARVVKQQQENSSVESSVQRDNPVPVHEASATPPFYESTLLWGALSSVIALVSVYLGFALKDIRWFLAIAWPFCVLVVVSLAKAIRRSRHEHGMRLSVILLGSILSAFGLWQLTRKFPPPTNQDIGQQIDDAIKRWRPNSQTGGTTQPSIPGNGGKPTRSYVKYVDWPVFASVSPTGIEGIPVVGFPLSFNVHFTATGPNPVTITNEDLDTEIVTDLNVGMGTYDSKQIKEVIGAFLREAKKEKSKLYHEGSDHQTLMPGDIEYSTAYAWTDNYTKHRFVTQGDLDSLGKGSETWVVMSVFTYVDGKETHHLRRCTGSCIPIPGLQSV
jgi:hypothetical protein